MNQFFCSIGTAIATTAAGLQLLQQIKEMLQGEKISRKHLTAAQEKLDSENIEKWSEETFWTTEQVGKEDIKAHVETLSSALHHLKCQDKQKILVQLKSLVTTKGKPYEIWKLVFENGKLESSFGYVAAVKCPDTDDLWIAIGIHCLEIKFAPRVIQTETPKYIFGFIPWGTKTNITEEHTRLSEIGIGRMIETYCKFKALQKFETKKIIDSITFTD